MLMTLPRMRPRDPAEPHRAPTSLELLFDLVFVVAVSRAAVELHHELAEGHVANALLAYPAVFFGIWWAWMGFTWFASAFDTDDWVYRILTFVQMGGVLVFAAGIHPFVVDRALTLTVVGYVIMRLALVSQWLRASRDPVHRAVARSYAYAIVLVQVGWLLALLVPKGVLLPVFAVLVVAELAVPALVERRGAHTPWHPGHVAERFGLFTIIVLGETILATANVLVEAIDVGEHLPQLLTVSAASLVLVASLWWVYFDRPQHDLVTSLNASLRWGYGHYLIFAGLGAVSAGVELAVDEITGDTGLGDVAGGLGLTVPVALFLLAVWVIILRPRRDPGVDAAVPALAVLVAASCLLPGATTVVVATALLGTAAAVVVGVRRTAPV